MVTKVLTGGAGGNLFTFADNFGYDADVITIAANDTALFYRIMTYSNERDEGETQPRIEYIDLSTAPALANRRVDIFSGSHEDVVTGSVGMEYVFDGSFNDVIDLRGGNDVAYVCSGNDSYNGGDGIDWLSFKYQSNDGNLAYVANSVGVRVDLQVTTAQNFGVYGFDTILNFENIDGGNGADRLYGNGEANRLLGSDGADLLYGRGGADKIFGEGGADLMQGNAGGDFMYCGDGVGGQDAAQDKVQFTRTSDSGTTTETRDTIYYFDRGGGVNDDRIDLSLLDGDAATTGRQGFTWLGNATAFTAGFGGQVRFQDLGDHVLVRIDTDGDFDTEMTIFVYGVGTLGVTDFML